MMFALAMQGVMRHIQALLYRSLRHKLLQGRATAPLAKRHPVGPDAAAVVDAAVGNIYGEVSPQYHDVKRLGKHHNSLRVGAARCLLLYQ